MKKASMISKEIKRFYRFRKALTIIFIIGLFMAFFSTTTLAQVTIQLPPLSEAALKFSPGQLVSSDMKLSNQFRSLNELLLIDELILKIKKFREFGVYKTSPIPPDLQCHQITVLIKAKIATLDDLKTHLELTDFTKFKKIDLLIELEIVDDLLLVQPQIRSWLTYIVTSRVCKSIDIHTINKLMDSQKELLISIKEKLLEALETD